MIIALPNMPGFLRSGHKLTRPFRFFVCNVEKYGVDRATHLAPSLIKMLHAFSIQFHVTNMKLK